MYSDTQFPAQEINMVGCKRLEISGDSIESHLSYPMRSRSSSSIRSPTGSFVPSLKAAPKIREPVELPRRRLPLRSLDGNGVIPVDGRCASRDGASRTLSVIVLITGHTIFRCHIGRHHLKQIELRCYLE